jgi:hypothetical protein
MTIDRHVLSNAGDQGRVSRTLCNRTFGIRYRIFHNQKHGGAAQLHEIKFVMRNAKHYFCVAPVRELSPDLVCGGCVSFNRGHDHSLAGF